jgi:hypothetical protein
VEPLYSPQLEVLRVKPVDNVYSDRNLVCACSPMREDQEAADKA